MAKKGAGNFSITYDSLDLTQYVNQPEFEVAVAELEATVGNSTVTQSDIGLPTYTLNIQGDVAKAVQDKLAIPPTTKKNLVYTTGTGGELVTRTWTGTVFHSNYKESHPANGKSTFSCKLNISGAPTVT